MQKTSRRRAERSAPRSSPPRSWISTAQSAIRFAPLAGLFSATQSKRRRADQATVESFDEPLEHTLRSDVEINPPPSSDPIASMDPSVATEAVATTVPTENVALKSAALPQSGLSDSQRVVLFLPDPVTEDDLLRENLKRAATFRRRRLRRGRSRWLAENAGVIVFAIALLALAWIVATG
jgi:hypothetical protein